MKAKKISRIENDLDTGNITVQSHRDGSRISGKGVHIYKGVEDLFC